MAPGRASPRSARAVRSWAPTPGCSSGGEPLHCGRCNLRAGHGRAAADSRQPALETTGTAAAHRGIEHGDAALLAEAGQILAGGRRDGAVHEQDAARSHRVEQPAVNRDLHDAAVVDDADADDIAA